MAPDIGPELVTGVAAVLLQDRGKVPALQLAEACDDRPGPVPAKTTHHQQAAVSTVRATVEHHIERGQDGLFGQRLPRRPLALGLPAGGLRVHPTVCTLFHLNHNADGHAAGFGAAWQITDLPAQLDELDPLVLHKVQKLPHQLGSACCGHINIRGHTGTIEDR